MANSCCSKRENHGYNNQVQDMRYRGIGSAYERAKLKNSTRYKYLTLPPLTKGLKLDIVSLNTSYGVVWYSYDVTIAISKKGCTSDCETVLTYDATLINDNSVTFVFDQKFMELCKGRYEGTISIGCNELPCKLDLTIGQQLCFGMPTAEQSLEVDGITPVIDALDIKDPSCCVKCEQPKPCGCRDNNKQHAVCSNSFPCTPQELDISFAAAEEQLAKLDEWLASMDGECRDLDTQISETNAGCGNILPQITGSVVSEVNDEVCVTVDECGDVSLGVTLSEEQLAKAAQADDTTTPYDDAG